MIDTRVYDPKKGSVVRELIFSTYVNPLWELFTYCWWGKILFHGLFRVHGDKIPNIHSFLEDQETVPFSISQLTIVNIFDTRGPKTPISVLHVPFVDRAVLSLKYSDNELCVMTPKQLVDINVRLADSSFGHLWMVYSREISCYRSVFVGFIATGFWFLQH